MLSRALLVLPLLIACGGGPDLPEGWEDAELIAEFNQSDCQGDPPAGGQVDAQLGPGTLSITWQDATFRCDQPVEGYVKRIGVTHEILVQPVDLLPDEYARCDCLYDLDWRYNVNEDLETVTLFSRRDEIGGASSPQTIGTFNFTGAE